MAETDIKPWEETKVVGRPLPRVDGYQRVSGLAEYSMDVSLPGMLHAAILRCPHGHATVKRVDVSAAKEMPGVRAVLTDADPEAKIGWFSAPGPGAKAMSRLFDPHCRYQGEEIAAVAADTPHQAQDALRAIRVEYDVSPAVISMEDALKSGAPPVQEGGNRLQAGQGIRRGDVAKGFADADIVLEETYRTPCQMHTCVESHGSVAHWDGDSLTVWDSNQGPFAIQESLASAFHLPLSNVRVISNYMGGGFGSKLDLGKYTVIAALLSRKAERPVKLFLTREETFLATGNRPAHLMKLKAGVKKDGTLTALELHGTGEMGAYPAMTSVAYLIGDLYKCPNVLVEETQAYLNAGPNRAFRAPGFPQGAWALEQMMDALAEKLGLDPIELRLKNLSTVCQMAGNRPYTSNGLRQCLEQGAEAFHWAEGHKAPQQHGPWVRGVGVAAGMWGSQGGPPSTAIVRVFADGSVNLNMGAADLGTGTKTVMAMVVSEELGLPLGRIAIEWADTGTTQFTRPSGGSKTVFADSPAVRSAAADARRQLIELAAAQLRLPAGQLALKDGSIVSADGSQKLAISDLRQLQLQQVVVGVGQRGPDPVAKVVRPFVAHFAEVEVNTLTGEFRVLRMAAAHDSGRVMNLLTYRNQVFGGQLQGLGYATMERRILDPGTGRMLNANWHDYKIPTAKDTPEMICVPVDVHDTECNTTGTKGIGEPATIPTSAAIANALYHAVGIRITQGPITPAKILMSLEERRKKG